jgi:hypothetical protein
VGHVPFKNIPDFPDFERSGFTLKGIRYDWAAMRIMLIKNQLTSLSNGNCNRFPQGQWH